MSAEEIANKLWRLCNVLRDDGITYHQYLNELTYLLFLRLSESRDFVKDIPAEYRWKKLIEIKDNKELFDHYKVLLADIATKSKNKLVQEIFTNASTSLRKPVNLNTLVASINDIDWTEDDERDKIAHMYESLLEKNATEKKSGAGQYFTPRPLIDVMVDLMTPKLGEKWNDPAAGTFGFMISANEYLKRKHDYQKLKLQSKKFQLHEAFSGCELVQDAHRLALMNAKLHGLESEILLADALGSEGESMTGFNGVLANPPFGTKKGGERPNRGDLTFKTANKQLNFLQIIYRSLKTDGSGRAAVVLPDNVLFEDGDGQKIRRDLMDKCNLHTILRLPTGIFYAQGVKTNVLFFQRGTKEKGNTKEVWFYDLRTNMESLGKRNPLARKHFAEFVLAYTGGISIEDVKENFDGAIYSKKREKIADPRWQKFTREEIAAKNDSLDVGLIADENLSNNGGGAEPAEIAKAAQAELNGIMKELEFIINELS
jgi:type I restriction enzyme M protein